MRIIAYTYDANVHCPDCAFEALKFGKIGKGLPYPPGEDLEPDEHGIPQCAEDSEGNPVHPVFSTDEQLEPLFCGDCGEEIE